MTHNAAIVSKRWPQWHAGTPNQQGSICSECNVLIVFLELSLSSKCVIIVFLELSLSSKWQRIHGCKCIYLVHLQHFSLPIYYQINLLLLSRLCYMDGTVSFVISWEHQCLFLRQGT